MEVFLKVNDALKHVSSEPKPLIEVQTTASHHFAQEVFGVVVDTHCLAP